MMRYLLFAGDSYYPLGGWRDYVASFDTMESALVTAAQQRRDWWHIVDMESGHVVKTSHEG